MNAITLDILADSNQAEFAAIKDMVVMQDRQIQALRDSIRPIIDYANSDMLKHLPNSARILNDPYSGASITVGDLRELREVWRRYAIK